MATIDSIEFYLKRTMTFSLGETITVKVYPRAASTTAPNNGVLLAAKTIDANDILLGEYGWVSFAFDAPATLDGDGFYGVHLYTNGFSQYRMSFMYYRKATDISLPSIPYVGDERVFKWDGDSWNATNNPIPYKILGTDTDGNDAVGLGDEISFLDGDVYKGYGIRSYIIAGEADRQVLLSSPTNGITGITLRPLLEWTISGSGPRYGSYEDQDFLFIYLKKNDAGFTENDLLASWVQAFYNDDLQVVAGLEYNTTYYWQVQGANTAGDLLDSEVWSFTTQVFAPPTYSTHLVSGLPTGENNQITMRRLIAAANNKIWYESVESI